MKLLEYEAKAILQKYAIPVPYSQLITQNTTSSLTLPAVLKSQVPIGGRGKLGGIKIVTTTAEAQQVVGELFARDIRGYLPTTLLAEEKLGIAREFYLSLLINRQEATIQLVAHTNGGVEVEENDPTSFLKINLNNTNHLVAGEQLAEYFDTPEQTFILQDLVKKLYACFTKNDALLLEINPLVLTNEGTFTAGDCKMELDDSAAFRHQDWQFEERAANTNFVTLDEAGTVATIANGAGLAMATVDAVTAKGMKPANFLDIGGGANSESVLAAFTRIMEYSHVKAIVINIFAGITRCDEVAKAIIVAQKQMSNLPPLFIRLNGTNFEEAVSLLSAEGITTLASLDACLTAAKEVTRE